MSPTASVVIPAYNAEGTIVRAVQSAMAQSVAPLEVVVGCDGCTDDTAAKARECGAVALELPKGNGSTARNAAARRAVGTVLFFLDADDWWEETKIERHLAIWSEAQPSFVIDRSTPICEDGSRAHWTGGIERDGEADWSEFLSYRSWASGSSFSVLKAAYDSIGGFREDLNKFQDVDFWVRCAHTRGPARTISDSLTNYQVSNAATVSKTTSRVDENLESLFDGWPFVSDDQKEAFASHAFLTAAEVTPWPKSVELFKKAHWPVSKPFFWKSLLQSLRRSA